MFHYEPTRAYQRWYPSEDTALINFLSRGRGMSQIMLCLRRSEGSIRSRIMLLYKRGAIRIEPMGGDE
jgi:hypothetical protein